MKSLPPGSAPFAVLLLVSLGIKIATLSPPPNDNHVPGAIAAARLLRAEGFDVRLVRLTRSPNLLAVARRGDCRIRAGGYPIHDTFADIYEDLARPVGPVHFLFQGRVTDEAPKWRARLAYYLWTVKIRIGLAAAPSPIIAIAASPQCELERVHWGNVAALGA